MNPFRQMLHAHGAKTPIGTWVMSASPIVAEAIGSAGFEWGVIDMEHTPLDMMDLLDAGAQTLMFPFVQDAVEARRAVAATRYPPEGMRGMAGMSRASRYGTTPDYLRTANKGVGVVLQLETPKAVAALEEIAAVPGVDALFVGPADLSGAMGHAGELMHPKVVALMVEAARRARALDMPIGTVGGTPEEVTRYRAAGFTYVAVCSDLGLLMRGAQAALQALRHRDDSPHVHTLVEGTQTEASA